jgi:hypothetical protein
MDSAAQRSRPRTCRQTSGRASAVPLSQLRLGLTNAHANQQRWQQHDLGKGGRAKGWQRAGPQGGSYG